MKKFVSLASLLTLLALVALLAAGCQAPAETKPETAKPETTEPEKTESGTAEPGAAATEFPKMELRFSTSTSPSEASYEGIMKMKEYVEEKTGGQVTIEIYAQSSLFTQEQEIPAIMKGNLEMCFSEAPWLVDYMPELAMYGSAYLFESFDHWDKFYSGELGQEMFENVAETLKVRPMGAVYLGARLINLTEDKEVLSREDLKGVKLRMPSTDAWLFLGEALGANPVPVGYADLYLALQTGTVDGQDNPLPALKNMSFYEVTKSATLSNHVIGTNWIMLSEELWQSMSDELKQIISDGVKIAEDHINQTNLSLEAELIPWLEEQGMSIYQPTPEALETLRKEVVDYYFAHEEVVGDWDMDMYQRIQDLA